MFSLCRSSGSLLAELPPKEPRSLHTDRGSILGCNTCQVSFSQKWIFMDELFSVLKTGFWKPLQKILAFPISQPGLFSSLQPKLYALCISHAGDGVLWMLSQEGAVPDAVCSLALSFPDTVRSSQADHSSGTFLPLPVPRRISFPRANLPVFPKRQWCLCWPYALYGQVDNRRKPRASALRYFRQATCHWN